MKRNIILATIISLIFAATISAQTAGSNFVGDWELDVSKSTLPATMPVESIVLKVSQTEKDLKIESVTKTSKNNAGMKGGVVKQTGIYSLEGKEMLTEVGSGAMAGKETRKASVTADGKLNLTLIRNLKDETGDVTIKINEIWELLDAGKTLKATRYMETPRGATNAEMFFTRKASEGIKTEIGTYTGSTSSTPTATVRIETPGPGKISGGVLNGKATRLVRPEYPAAARAVKASGAVNVQVTIDEQGNIISASAVSGHPLLRQAAEQAARQAQFAPILLEGVPVKVTGVIVYNFVP